MARRAPRRRPHPRRPHQHLRPGHAAGQTSLQPRRHLRPGHRRRSTPRDQRREPAMTALVLTVTLAGLIGISLGLLGGGGSILAVPLLVYVARLPTKEAIATSLLVVGTTSAVAVLPHARGGRVRWRTGVVFGLAGMTGAYTGGRLAAHVPAGLLLVAFALMMLATAAAMIRGRRGANLEPAP